jgi:hypothetical protein
MDMGINLDDHMQAMQQHKRMLHDAKKRQCQRAHGQVSSAIQLQ